MCFLSLLAIISLVTFARLRTGMLAMLLQSILGLSDDEIILDYFKSNQMQKGSAALGRLQNRGTMDHDIFSGTNPEAMETTLRFLRSKYGSVSPGYLNGIGFDEIWRQRLLAVIKRTSSRL
jgi:protein tyrosine/serine phosphatase